MEILLDLVVFADEYVPPGDWRAQIAVPTAIIFLLGGTYMLLRSNLGTLRAYLVIASSFFGFMMLISLFWAFGAPGTPPYTGPQNLPGQPIDYYQPKWVPFAEDSVVAEQPEYQAAQNYPEAFDEVPADQEGFAEDGSSAILDFFSQDPDDPEATSWIIGSSWVETEVGITTAENDRPLLYVEFTEPLEDAPTDPDPEGETFVAFGYFDEGNLIFPSLVFIILSAIGFILHMVLLAWDERQERRDLEEDLSRQQPEEEKVPAGV